VLVLRKSKVEDEAEVKKCYERSALLHVPWSYPPTDFLAYLAEAGRYFLCLENTGEIVGTFNISGVVYGRFQSAYLGYEVFSPHENRGYMTAGFKLLISQAFDQLNLHRLEANIQPGNNSSIKLVSRIGFVKEGYSKNYLDVGGFGWKDHERWALVNPGWRSGSS